VDEVACKLALDLVLRRLLDTPELGGDLDILGTLNALARMQGAGIQREKWKSEVARQVAHAAQACERTARQGGLSERSCQEIRAKILGIQAA
jgi:hypothetical protein